MGFKLHKTLNGVGLNVGSSIETHSWNAAQPDAVIPCGIAAVIFAAAFPFYLMLKETKTTVAQTSVLL